MNRVEEWDWPPRARRRRFYRTVDVYQPGGWGSPVAKKIVHVYFQVTLAIVKMLLAVPLLLIAIGAFWLLWHIIVITL
jgi:hypothetical protein